MPPSLAVTSRFYPGHVPGGLAVTSHLTLVTSHLTLITSQAVELEPHRPEGHNNLGLSYLVRPFFRPSHALVMSRPIPS
eukprot:234524-Rhodomonas_salina.2